MGTHNTSIINGMRFELVFFDYIYMLGELLSSLSELHVKVQLVERFSNKVLHNLELLEKRGAKQSEMEEFLRVENQELVLGLKRQNIFYDKYRLKMLRIFHQGTQGELLVEDPYGGSKYVVPVKLIVEKLLNHTFDSTTIQDMELFEVEEEVVRLTSSVDPKPGETAHRVVLQLNEAARNVHVYVKKEKLAGVGYLAAGRPVNDQKLIAQAEAQSTEKGRFLNHPIISALFPERRQDRFHE